MAAAFCMRAISRSSRSPLPLVAKRSAGSSPFGLEQNLFAPAQLGHDFEIHPQGHLASLSPYQDYLTIVSDTDSKMALAFSTPEIGGDHYRSSAVFLTTPRRVANKIDSSPLKPVTRRTFETSSSFSRLMRFPSGRPFAVRPASGS